MLAVDGNLTYDKFTPCDIRHISHAQGNGRPDTKTKLIAFLIAVRP
jgi:hypothetical protein